MHIILGILKILGIVLLIILGLILLIVGIVLFVPVRYQAEASNNGSLRAGAHVSWLLRLIRADVTFEEKKLRIRISLLGKVRKEIPEPSETETEPEDEGGAPEETAAEEEKPAEEKPAEENPVEEPAIEPQETRPVEDKPVEQPVKKKPKAQTPKPQKQEKKPQKVRQPSFVTRITGKLASLPQMISDLITRIYDTYDRTEDRADAVLRKLESVQHKIGMVTDAGSMKFYRKTVRRLFAMIRHFRFRSITGDIRIGTGSPDLTGMLCGVIYTLLPASADRFTMDPDFYEAVFEGDVHLKGHIRLCHPVFVALTVLVNPEFYRLLKKIKKIRRGA